MRRLLQTLAPALAALFLVAATPGQVPEPAGLWQGPLHGYTPNTLQGAEVIDATRLAALLAAARRPVLLDVAEADRKPANLPKTALWLPTHRSIPGTVWLPGAGQGTDDATFRDSFRKRVVELTGGDRAAPIVTFCHPECWGSWNAAKRLVGLGYEHVFWYPDGMEGWQAAHDTAAVKADPQWTESGPGDSGHGDATQ